MSLPARVAAAKALLEEVADEHGDLRAEQRVDLMEAIEFLSRLEDSFHDGRVDD